MKTLQFCKSKHLNREYKAKTGSELSYSNLGRQSKKWKPHNETAVDVDSRKKMGEID